MLRDLFLKGMSSAASTVSIVTTDGPSGRAGLTVSAMSSVSADPPSLLICVNAQSKSAEAINRNAVFCVNVLNDNQVHVSDVFAARSALDDKFSCASWRRQITGAPALVDALVSFDCKLRHSFQWGSHYILIGEIVDIGMQRCGNPLIYTNRSYGRAVKIAAVPKSLAARTDRAAIRLGSFITASAMLMPRLIAAFINEGHTDPVALSEGTRSSLLQALVDDEIDLAVLYQREPLINEGLKTHELAAVHPYVLLASSYPLARKAQIALADLAELPLVSLAAPSAGMSFIDSIFEAAKIEPFRAHLAPSFEVLRGMVGNGLGYAITFTYPAASLSYDGMPLVRIPIADAVEPAHLVLVHRSEAVLRPAVVQFISYCKQHLSKVCGS